MRPQLNHNTMCHSLSGEGGYTLGVWEIGKAGYEVDKTGQTKGWFDIYRELE